MTVLAAASAGVVTLSNALAAVDSIFTGTNDCIVSNGVNSYLSLRHKLKDSISQAPMTAL